jgi:hypothetical protein
MSRPLWKLTASESASASAAVLSFVFCLLSWRVILTWTECFVTRRWKFALVLESLPIAFVVDDLSMPKCEMRVQVVPEA